MLKRSNWKCRLSFQERNIVLTSFGTLRASLSPVLQAFMNIFAPGLSRSQRLDPYIYVAVLHFSTATICSSGWAKEKYSWILTLDHTRPEGGFGKVRHFVVLNPLQAWCVESMNWACFSLKSCTMPSPPRQLSSNMIPTNNLKKYISSPRSNVDNEYFKSCITLSPFWLSNQLHQCLPPCALPSLSLQRSQQLFCQKLG